MSSGEIKYRETVVDGIEHMPDAFIGLLAGDNTARCWCASGPDPA